MFDKNSNFIRYLFVYTTTILTVVILFLFFQYIKVLDKTMASMEDMKKQNVNDFSKNIELILKKNFDIQNRDIFTLSPDIRRKGNNILSLFSSNQYPFIYIITKDKKGKYRYILDGSHSERGEYLQKFDPVELDTWNNAWKTGKPQWKSQNSVDGLWVTYLYPMVVGKKSRMLIAFDYSAKERTIIDNAFKPIKNYLLATAVLLVLFMMLVYVFGFLFYQQRKKTYKDPLTKLYNRHYLNYIASSLSLDDIAIAIIDLDHFKRVNDTYGHKVGDGVLRGFAAKLRDSIRTKDILIRYGGEEFLLFLHKGEKTSKSNLKNIINSIQERISKDPIYIDNTQIKIAASIGFNATPHLNRSIDNAIAVADKMLYVAKTSGRNRVEIFEEKQEEKHIIYGPREVTEAINENRLTVYFQPITDIKKDKIVKYEALVRIIDKNNNIILPYKFLQNIKTNTIYRSMSKIVLEQAFKTIDRYGVSVSINFDIGDFLDETLYELVYDTIKKREDLSSKISIELLEDQEIGDFKEVNSRIKKLKNLGVNIAIDDFGTGYSTFSYLLALDPDILKIDGFLIQRLPTSEQARSIVRHIVSMCKELDIEVIAEFVSDENIKSIAKELGIKLHQGYAIGRPSPNVC